MSFYIKGDTRPIIGKNIYTLMFSSTGKQTAKKNNQLYVSEKGDTPKEVDATKIVKQHWKLLKNGKLILDLGSDGKITFNQVSLGIDYTIEVVYTDTYGTKGTAKLDITPVAGKPSIQNLKWQNQYYEDLNGKLVGYLDNVRLFIHTLNIPVGDTLQVTIWEDEGTDGHGSSSRNMGTYTTTRVDKYGKAELYFNNIKVYQKILNDKDLINEKEHEFYAQVKYKGKIDTIEDTIQLKIVNQVIKLTEVPKNNTLVTVFTPDKQKQPENKKGVKVTVNVFFDGTLNNAQNTKDRLAYQEGKVNKTATEDPMAFKKNAGTDSSYDNYFSNIAIMYDLNTTENKDKQIKIYIEGPGTRDHEEDDTMGFAFGSGDKSGIPVKVKKAFDKINDQIDFLKKKNFIKETEFVNEIELSVFGFSRGAAAARNFISLRLKLQNMYNLESSKLTIKFVGLFDTVSSFSKNASITPNFENDVEGKEGLGLKLEGNVQKVVHLTAADEYRGNFSLTNIKSSIQAGVGYELSLPGVHSDIGGGYEEIQKVEDRILSSNVIKFGEIKNELTKQGWYTPKQFYQIETNKDDNTDHIDLELHGSRKNIPNSYQYIPLAIMVKLAKKYDLSFDESLLGEGKKETYNVPEDLTEAKEALLNYAITNDGAHSKAVSIRAEKLCPIRNKYLHRSTSTSFGLEGRYKDNKPYRLPIDG
ncbi:DUF2235 domain-containing protein [Flavobacterium sp. LS1R49]|uniref:DUF2235 domain-containing protein n=1 Tax=Flavobacterium shii TaxID=2987687 RepID=A0A9X2ZFM9_9FLAO|nr:DUF2235 domain-containing protein [Flavobacterium shii]MCV9929780.1 DUF2235 domain-containing protein [Flavobacterium shii]